MPSAVSSSTNLKQDTHQTKDTQQEESMNFGDNVGKEDKNKSTMHTDMLLNNDVEIKEEIAEEDVSQETKNSLDLEKSSDQAPRDSELKEPEPAQEIDQNISVGAEKKNENKIEDGDNKGDLDIESMLAAIHNDNPPPDSSETQNAV